MTLKQVTQELSRVMEELNTSIPSIEALDYQYQTDSAKWLLQSKETTESKRQAEVTLRLEESGLLHRRLDAKFNVRVLLTQKECLIEISKNLRLLEGHKV